MPSTTSTIRWVDEVYEGTIPTVSLAPTPVKKAPQTMEILNYPKSIGSVFDRRGFQKSKEDCVIGLELENESVEPVDFPSIKGWVYHAEGSLRYHGYEFVLSPPLPKDNALKGTFNLLKSLSYIKATNSRRTSVHVHFDVTQYTYADLMNFSLLYWLCEEVLSDFAGDFRKSNLFCLRLKDAKYSIEGLASAVKRQQFYKSNVFTDTYRYASLNLASVQKFGSLEFRMMRGTTTYADIETWVNALDRVRLFALQFATPKDLREFFLKKINAEDLPQCVFGDLLSALTSKPSSSYAEDIRESFLLLEQLFTAGGSWDFEKEIAAAKAQVKKAQEDYVAQALREQEARAAARRMVGAPSTGDLPDEGSDQYERSMDSVAIRDWSDE